MSLTVTITVIICTYGAAHWGINLGINLGFIPGYLLERYPLHPTKPLHRPYVRGSAGIPGGLFTSREEEESDDGFEHALVFFYGCSVSAAFLAEHAPCLEVCDGVLDSRPDFA